MKRALSILLLAGGAASLSPAAVRVSELPAVRGTIGLGTWLTEAEYKDIEVTAGDRVLYRSDFTTEAKDWTPSGGDWKVVEGAYRQSDLGENRRSVLRVPELADAVDYTVRLKARKLAGREGFLVMFHVRDEDFYWLNLGGWNNTAHAIERKRVGVGRRVPGRIETGRWYDIRIELAGPRIRCFLNNAPILDVSE
jgi:hypothetical protein